MDSKEILRMDLIKKTFLILESMAECQGSISLNELTQKVNMPKSTVYRIIRTLCESGYVQGAEGSGYYEITRRLSRIAEGNRYGDLLSMALPYLNRMHHEFNETVNLGIRERHDIRYLHVIETTRSLRWILQPGETDSLYTTALGKAILASKPQGESGRLLDHAEKRKLISRKQSSGLLREIPAIRGNRWAIDRENTVEGVICMAFSLREKGWKDSAISIAIPTVRYNTNLQGRVTRAFLEILDEIPDSKVA